MSENKDLPDRSAVNTACPSSPRQPLAALTPVLDSTTPNRQDSTSSTFRGDDDSRLPGLRSWLKGHINNPDFFTAQPQHSLPVLQTGLHYAINYLRKQLDPRLLASIHAAGESETCIEIDETTFLAGRKLDVDELGELVDRQGSFASFSRETCVRLLIMAREEFAWVSEETTRLEVHCKNAREVKSYKLRGSFSYWPLKRKEGSESLEAIMGFHGEYKGVGIIRQRNEPDEDTQEWEEGEVRGIDAKVGQEIADSDEEMLDERRDSGRDGSEDDTEMVTGAY